MQTQGTIQRTRREVPVAWIVVLALLGFGSTGSAAILIPAGADWKDLDNGTDQGTAWRGTNFNDSAWAVGRAQFGYGDNDEVTVVSYGSANNKYITTYFRHSFNADSNAYSNLTLSLLR